MNAFIGWTQSPLGVSVVATLLSLTIASAFQPIRSTVRRGVKYIASIRVSSGPSRERAREAVTRSRRSPRWVVRPHFDRTKYYLKNESRFPASEVRVEAIGTGLAIASEAYWLVFPAGKEERFSVRINSEIQILGVPAKFEITWVDEESGEKRSTTVASAKGLF